MDTINTESHKVNLTRKRKIEEGLWRFYPVHWKDNKPNPHVIIINGEPTTWKGGGAYFLDWREDGRRTRVKC